MPRLAYRICMCTSTKHDTTVQFLKKQKLKKQKLRPSPLLDPADVYLRTLLASLISFERETGGDTDRQTNSIQYSSTQHINRGLFVSQLHLTFSVPYLSCAQSVRRWKQVLIRHLSQAQYQEIRVGKTQALSIDYRWIRRLLSCQRCCY